MPRKTTPTSKEKPVPLPPATHFAFTLIVGVTEEHSAFNGRALSGPPSAHAYAAVGEAIDEALDRMPFKLDGATIVVRSLTADDSTVTKPA